MFPRDHPSLSQCGWDSDLFFFFCRNTLFHLSVQPSLAVSAPANFPFRLLTSNKPETEKISVPVQEQRSTVKHMMDHYVVKIIVVLIV